MGFVNDMSELVFSPWYINTRRLADLTGATLGPSAQTSVAGNNADRVSSMDVAKGIAQELVASGQIQKLSDLIVTGAFPGNVVAGVWTNIIFRGAGAAALASFEGRPFSKPSFTMKLAVGDATCSLDGTLEIEHFYSTSAVDYLSGQKQVYLFGKLSLEPGAQNGTAVAWLIGDLIEPIDLGLLRMSFASKANVHPQAIDAFSNMAPVRPPSAQRLNAIMRNISESNVKEAFAEIIGEPFVPKDWAGERSDLYTSRVTVNGVATSAAFLLKGPSVSGPMHVADLGRRGDQIARLFDEPADLLVLQHGNKVETAVVKTMRAFAVIPSDPRRYCIIDGADTYRILKAYGYLDDDGRFRSPASS
jgi:hypothetical protein